MVVSANVALSILITGEVLAQQPYCSWLLLATRWLSLKTLLWRLSWFVWLGRFTKFILKLDIFLISCWKIDNMAFINFFAKKTWTHALLNIWNIAYHFVFSVGLFLILNHLMLLCNSRILLISTSFFLLLCNGLSLLDKLLLHGSSSCVGRGDWFTFWLYTFYVMLHVLNPVCCVWSFSQQWWSNYILQHWLPI